MRAFVATGTLSKLNRLDGGLRVGQLISNLRDVACKSVLQCSENQEQQVGYSMQKTWTQVKGAHCAQ